MTFVSQLHRELQQDLPADRMCSNISKTAVDQCILRPLKRFTENRNARAGPRTLGTVGILNFRYLNSHRRTLPRRRKFEVALQAGRCARRTFILRENPKSVSRLSTGCLPGGSCGGMSENQTSGGEASEFEADELASESGGWFRRVPKNGNKWG